MWVLYSLSINQMKEKEMEPISVAIFTLNEEKRIGRLLDDLVNQTHQDFEVVPTPY